MTKQGGKSKEQDGTAKPVSGPGKNIALDQFLFLRKGMVVSKPNGQAPLGGSPSKKSPQGATPSPSGDAPEQLPAGISSSGDDLYECKVCNMKGLKKSEIITHVKSNKHNSMILLNKQ